MLKIRDEYDYLIHLASCALRGEKPMELPEEMDFNVVLKHGISHEIANLAFYSVEKLQNPPEEKLYARWKEIRDRAIVKDINQSAVAEDIRSILKNAGVSVYELQGTKMKPLYPMSDMRTMSDMDFIVYPEQLELARETLSASGYDCEIISDIEFHITQAPNIFVEVHADFTIDGGRSDYIEELTVSDNKKDNEAAFYIFSILHVAKHYFSRGCGIRRIMDVYILNRDIDKKADMDFIRKALKKSGRLKFLKEVSALADYWFGESVNETSKIAKMAAEIKGSGLHGVFSTNMNEAFENKKKLGIKGAKFKYFVKRIFPSITFMHQIFPFLGKHRYLLPVFWIWRILKGIFSKWKIIWSEFKKGFKR